MTKSARQISEDELLQRLGRWTADRYGMTLDRGWLKDLIKDKLIRKAERFTQHGRQPVYRHDAVDYRQAMRIARLRSRGVVGRDAIRLILFINGYGMPTTDAKGALLRAWPIHGRSVLAGIRSSYGDNHRTIKSKHRASLIAQLGKADGRIVEAGAVLDPDFLIGALRDAVQEPLATDIKIMPLLAAALSNDRIDWAELASLVQPLMSGFLMFSSEADPSDAKVDYFEGMVLAATPADLERAREMVQLFQRNASTLLVTIGALSEPVAGKALDHAIHFSVQRSAAWASLILFTALLFARLVPQTPTSSQLQQMRVGISQLDRSTIPESAQIMFDRVTSLTNELKL